MRQKSLQLCAGGCGRFCGNAHRCVADATSTYFAVLILAATRVLAGGISAPTASCPQAVLLPRLPCSNGAFAGCGRLKTHCYTSRASTCTRRPRLGTSPGNGASSPSDSPMRSPSIRCRANPSLGSPFGPRPCFTHGQFYVAASRSGHPDNLHFFVKPTVEGVQTSTVNVVVPEIYYIRFPLSGMI